MASTVLSAGFVELFIPFAAIVGILFALVQWYLVSKIGVSHASSSSNNGFSDYMLEEDGIDQPSVVEKCAEIQEAISLGAQPNLPALCHWRSHWFHDAGILDAPILHPSEHAEYWM